MPKTLNTHTHTHISKLVFHRVFAGIGQTLARFLTGYTDTAAQINKVMEHKHTKTTHTQMNNV